MRTAFAWAFAWLALPAWLFAQSASSLVQLSRIIERQGCTNAKLPADLASAFVESYSVLKDGDRCIIAFFRSLDQRGTPLEIISANTASSRWDHAPIPVANTERSSIGSLDLEGEYILVSMHYSFDDNAIPIIDSKLKKIGTIYGTFVRSWPNGLLEYDVHQPRFGPHDVEIGVFDPKTATDRQIYPLEPCDPVRADYVRQVREAFDGSIDREAGDRCWTESQRIASSYFDWQTNAFAFAAELLREYAAPPDWDKRTQVMVTCEGLATIKSIKCRETPLEAWQSARPDLNLTQLIAFAASQPRFR